MPIAQFPLSSAFRRFSNKVIRDMTECVFRKPNRYLFDILCLLKNSNNLLYISISNILENNDTCNRKIG